MTAIKTIRLKCPDCCCSPSTETRLCPCKDCPLHSFLMGQNPDYQKEEMSDTKWPAPKKAPIAQNAMKYYKEFDSEVSAEGKTSPGMERLKKMKNKKAAPVLQHRDSGGEQITMPGDHTSKQEFTTSQGAGQVEALLPRGMENALQAAELVRLLGLRNSSELRHQVAMELSRWALIPSLPAVGYWPPTKSEEGHREARLYLRSLSARARNTAKAAAALWLQEGKRGQE